MEQRIGTSSDGDFYDVMQQALDDKVAELKAEDCVVYTNVFNVMTAPRIDFLTPEGEFWTAVIYSIEDGWEEEEEEPNTVLYTIRRRLDNPDPNLEGYVPAEYPVVLREALIQRALQSVERKVETPHLYITLVSYKNSLPEEESWLFELEPVQRILRNVTQEDWAQALQSIIPEERATAMRWYSRIQALKKSGRSR